MSAVLEARGLASDALAEARALIGEPIRIEQWTHEATRDTIRRYAWGIGDDNPLWCEPDYARRTRWGDVIAPPTFLYAVFDAVVAPGLPEVQWIYSGADWTFDAPVRRGEEIRAEARLADAREVGGERVARMIVQTGEVEYRAGDGRRVARVLSHCFRIPRQGAEGGLRYPEREEPAWSAADLAEIERKVLSERRRGAQPRYFEDVSVGEEIPPIVRGPLNRLDMTCYYAGAVGTSGYKSTRLKWLYAHAARHHPEALPNNYDPSYYAAAVSPSIGHQDAAIARSEIGMPGPYDNGPQRIGMMASAVTDWMGDDGRMTALSARLKLPVIFGDVSTFGGTVSAVRPAEAGGGLVEVELAARNQLGQTTARGRATVLLPARNQERDRTT